MLIFAAGKERQSSGRGTERKGTGANKRGN